MTASTRAALALLLLPACKLASEPRLVAVNPDYAYTDGCTAVSLTGANLGTAATGAIGGNPIESWAPAQENPDLPEHAQDVGFLYTGISPAASDAAGGFVDVTMSIDGETLTLDRGFYYIACPATFYVEAADIGDTNAVGDAIGLYGCGMDVSAIEGRLYSADTPADAAVATFSLTSDCRGAITHFEVPDVAEGTYWLELAHTDGTTFGGNCPPDTDPDTDTDTDPGTDTDTGTEAPCEPPVITVAAGGAR